jgi:DNA-binding NtrC family response regulator
LPGTPAFAGRTRAPCWSEHPVESKSYQLVRNMPKGERMPPTTGLREQLAANADNPIGLLRLLLPGTSAAMERLRLEVLRFCESLQSKTLLLVGPIGIGKTTVARIVALLRYLLLVRLEIRQAFLKTLKFDGPVRVGKQLLNWYEELNLTGLTEYLAEAQLFGVAPNAATGVAARPGIFEVASRGHMPKNKEVTLGANVTQGVVLLDEIGDLEPALQPKLLSVLAGAEVFRVGGEGNPEWGFAFNGVTIAATWRNVVDGSLVRPDLLSRLSDCVIEVPSLSGRAEDIPAIVSLVIEDIHRRREEEITRLMNVSDREVSVDRGRVRLMNDSRLSLTAEDMRLLTAHDWPRSGELRGLRQVLQRALDDGVPIAEALERQQPAASPKDMTADVDALAAGVLALLPSGTGWGTGFSERVKEVERWVRGRIRERLSGDEVELRRVAARVGIQPGKLKEQLGDLGRVRKNRRTTS